MALYLLKYPYRKILLPLAKKMKFINPDILGYLATFIALATLFCYIYALQKPVLLIVSIALTLFRMTLNTIDGVIAIERGNLKLKGEIVNALPDRYSDIFILIGIALSPLCTPLFGILGMASMFLVSYTGMLSKAIGAQWQHHGPLGKVERLIFIMIFSLLEYLHLPGKITKIGSFNYFEWLMIIFVILGQITVFNRLLMSLFSCSQNLKIHPVVAKDYFCNTKFKSFIFKTLLGVIPIERGFQKTKKENYFKEINEVLKKGETIIIYPEGTRGDDNSIKQFKSGVSHIAKMNPNVPVIPFYINGPDRILPRGAFFWVPFIADVYISKHLYYDNTPIKEFTEKIQEAIQKLKNEHKRKEEL